MGLGSALVPFLNAEAYAVVAAGTAPALGVALALAVGQTAGKLVLFESARRGSERWAVREESSRRARWTARVGRGSRRPADGPTGRAAVRHARSATAGRGLPRSRCLRPATRAVRDAGAHRPVRAVHRDRAPCGTALRMRAARAAGAPGASAPDRRRDRCRGAQSPGRTPPTDMASSRACSKAGTDRRGPPGPWGRAARCESRRADPDHRRQAGHRPGVALVVARLVAVHQAHRDGQPRDHRVPLGPAAHRAVGDVAQRAAGAPEQVADDVGDLTDDPAVRVVDADDLDHGLHHARHGNPAPRGTAATFDGERRPGRAVRASGGCRVGAGRGSVVAAGSSSSGLRRGGSRGR